MLVLQREVDESVIIGDDIVVTIVSVRDGRVRLGITAPIEIEVDRVEVRRAKERERREYGDRGRRRADWED